MNIREIMIQVRDEHDSIVDRIDELNKEIARLQSRRIYLEGRFSALKEIFESDATNQTETDSDCEKSCDNCN